MSAAHLFLDESKSRDYVIVAGAVLPDRLADARRDLRSLVLRGQSWLHFYKESPTRRRLILAAIAATGARSTVYSAAGYRRDSDARTACLAGVVTDEVRALFEAKPHLLTKALDAEVADDEALDEIVTEDASIPPRAPAVSVRRSAVATVRQWHQVLDGFDRSRLS